MTTCVSVDLDAPSCYHAIHGLPPATVAADAAALEVWLPRFLELFAELDLRATFFVVGRDLQRDLESGDRGSQHLRDALAAGHELANHSWSHDYALTTWSADKIATDLARCDALLREIGADPVGFRAPGYCHDERLLMQVGAIGYHYDSSALPSPAYYLAKVGAWAMIRAAGRWSATRLDTPRSFIGSTHPHFVPRAGVWEIPISVTPNTRLPLIGTSLLAGPAGIRGPLLAAAERADFLNLELHAIDLAGEGEASVQSLIGRELALGVPLSLRRQRLKDLLEARGHVQPLAALLRGRAA